MADPQKPDPNRRWCRKCRCHGKFKYSTVSSTGADNYTITSQAHLCVKCNREGFVPSNLKKAATHNAKIFGAILLILNVIFLIASASKLGFIEILKGLFLCPLISILPVGGYFWLHSLPFLDWKKWAKERGWEERKA